MYFPEKFHYFAKLILNLVHAKVFLHLVSADGGEPSRRGDDHDAGAAAAHRGHTHRGRRQLWKLPAADTTQECLGVKCPLS